MTNTHVRPNVPNHQLTGVTVSVHLDLTDGTVKLEHAYGKSDTTKGVLWYYTGGSPVALDDDPYCYNIVAGEVQALLEQVAHFKPNTQDRLDFVQRGGLQGMEPLF